MNRLLRTTRFLPGSLRRIGLDLHRDGANGSGSHVYRAGRVARLRPHARPRRRRRARTGSRHHPCGRRSPDSCAGRSPARRLGRPRFRRSRSSHARHVARRGGGPPQRRQLDARAKPARPDRADGRESGRLDGRMQFPREHRDLAARRNSSGRSRQHGSRFAAVDLRDQLSGHDRRGQAALPRDHGPRRHDRRARHGALARHLSVLRESHPRDGRRDVRRPRPGEQRPVRSRHARDVDRGERRTER